MKHAPILISTFVACVAVVVGGGLRAEEPTTGKDSNAQSLFNGKDLTGWHADVPESDNNPAGKNPFIVRDGMLVSLGTPGGHLITDAEHENYRLDVEYRFAAKPGNCGVLVHASTPRALYKMFPKSIEVQMAHENAGDFWCIVEDITVPDMEKRRGPKEKWGITEGKERRILNLTDGSEKPAGEWNTMVIECLNDQVKVWVNGDLVNHGFDCTAKKGKIALQAEGSEVEFRKLMLTPITEFSDDATPAAQAKLAGTGPGFKGPLGLQLYSLRDQFAKDVPGTLDKVREFGFKNVELAGTYGFTPEKFKAELDKRGLTAVSGHFPYERFRDDPEGIAREAKALGLKYAGCAWISHDGPFDEQACRGAAAVFNKAGETLAKQGIKVFYHTHGYEFQPYVGGTLFDLLMAETKPEFVTYEMDVFWVVHGGQDPVELLKKYGNRFALFHLKDMKDGTPVGLLTGKSDNTNDVALGQGRIDYRKVLSAAERAGGKWYFIEDESPTVEQQIPQSLRYLEQVTW